MSRLVDIDIDNDNLVGRARDLLSVRSGPTCILCGTELRKQRQCSGSTVTDGIESEQSADEWQ